MRVLTLALMFVAACAHAPVAVVTPAPVIAAERAFAADAAERGWAAAFRSAAAADATMLSPDPVNAHEQLGQIEGDGSTALDWRPAFAGVARSGDFGFTTGPFLFRGRDGIAGHYFTVWRQQPDGAWKWIFDAGTGVVDPGPAVAPDADIPMLGLAVGGAGSAQAAIDEVRALERWIAWARPDPREQLIQRLAEEVRLNRPGRAAAVGGQAAREAAHATTLEPSQEPLRIEASAAGDMVFVLGRTSWPDGQARAEGYSARIWQWRPEGWRIVFDEIVPGGGG
jgi:ketosteroid isomerase-like protein